MDRYIGLDAHASSCTVRPRSQWSEIATSGTGNQCQSLDQLPANHPQKSSAHLRRGNTLKLVARGSGTSCARDRRGCSTSSRGPKDDEHDAFGLAEDLRIGNVKVYKKQREFAEYRSIKRIVPFL